MGILSRIYDPTPSAETAGRAPYDPFWYGDPSGYTDTGITITPDKSLKYSVVWACVRLISQQVAGLPLMTFERTDDGKKPAPQHALYDLLHDRPNDYQTSYQFREMMMIHVLLRGNAYAYKMPGRRGTTSQLVPFHPDLITVERAKNGTVRYIYQPMDDDPITFVQDEIFHLAGPSMDGLEGVSVISLAAQGIGLSLAMESYGALFFKQNATPRIALEMEHNTDGKDVDSAIQKAWMETYGGLSNAHKPAILKMGMKAHVIGLSNEDSQFLESRNHQVPDIARWFMVKPHKVGDLTRATFNNIEHQSIEHLTDTLDPWLVRFEQTCQRDLILQPRKFFCEFVREGLLQADIKSKNEAFALAVQNGWMSRNEVRQRLNLNVVDGLDEYLVPMNMGTQSQADEVAQQAAAQPEPEPEPPPQENGRARAIAKAAAERVVAKELASLKKWGERLGDTEEYRKWLDSFYDKHLVYAADALLLVPSQLREHYEKRKTVLEAYDPGTEIDYLVALAMGEK